MDRRRLQGMNPTGVEEEVPYDRTGLSGDGMPDMSGGVPGAPDPTLQGPGGGMPSLDQLGGDQGQPAPQQGTDLASLGAPEDMQMPNDEDVAVQEMTQALDDPNTPPEMKSQIQQELALAARRRLAGMGGV